MRASRGTRSAQIGLVNVWTFQPNFLNFCIAVIVVEEVRGELYPYMNLKIEKYVFRC